MVPNVGDILRVFSIKSVFFPDTHLDWYPTRRHMPVRHQAIDLIDFGALSVGPLGAHFVENWIMISFLMIMICKIERLT